MGKVSDSLKLAAGRIRAAVRSWAFSPRQERFDVQDEVKYIKAGSGGFIFMMPLIMRMADRTVELFKARAVMDKSFYAPAVVQLQDSLFSEGNSANIYVGAVAIKLGSEEMADTYRFIAEVFEAKDLDQSFAGAREAFIRSVIKGILGDFNLNDTRPQQVGAAAARIVREIYPGDPGIRKELLRNVAKHQYPIAYPQYYDARRPWVGKSLRAAYDQQRAFLVSAASLLLINPDELTKEIDEKIKRIGSQ